MTILFGWCPSWIVQTNCDFAPSVVVHWAPDGTAQLSMELRSITTLYYTLTHTQTNKNTPNKALQRIQINPVHVFIRYRFELVTNEQTHRKHPWERQIVTVFVNGNQCCHSPALFLKMNQLLCLDSCRVIHTALLLHHGWCVGTRNVVILAWNLVQIQFNPSRYSGGINKTW